MRAFLILTVFLPLQLRAAAMDVTPANGFRCDASAGIFLKAEPLNGQKSLGEIRQAAVRSAPEGDTEADLGEYKITYLNYHGAKAAGATPEKIEGVVRLRAYLSKSKHFYGDQYDYTVIAQLGGLGFKRQTSGVTNTEDYCKTPAISEDDEDAPVDRLRSSVCNSGEEESLELNVNGLDMQARCGYFGEIINGIEWN